MTQQPRQIWKYHLDRGMTVLTMPAGSTVLTAQEQRGNLVLWAMVDPSLPPTEERKFFVVGTGWDFNAHGLAYIATYQPTPELVFHVFEEVNP